jgi:ABC-type bacteriocin/lantibiotic exporter with double-glycine peptidase domain
MSDKNKTEDFLKSYKVLCDYLDIDASLPPMNIIKNLGDPAEEILYLSGLRHKEISLPEKWWNHNGGAMMGELKDGTPVAILPHAIWGYRFYNPKTGETKKVNAKNACEISADASAIYRTFPPENIRLGHITKLLHQENLYKEIIIILLCCFIGSVIQVLPAILSETIFDTIIPENMRLMLVEIVIILVVFELVNIGFSILTNLGISRIGTKAGLAVHTALCDRLLYLKMPFFNRFTAGELLEKIKGIDRIKDLLFKDNLKIIIFNIFVFVEIVVMFRVCAEITPAVLLMLASLIALHIVAGRRKYRINRRLIDAENKVSTFVHQSVQGMHRVMVSCAQDRVYNIWNSLETDKRVLLNRIKKIDNALDSLDNVFKILSVAVVYLLVINADSVSMGAFIAFISTYSILQRSVFEFLEVVEVMPELTAVYNNIKPILESPVEHSTLKSVPSEFSGSIELNNVLFRYDKFGKTIINDVSMKIENGECVGILGASGSGKSTLMKLLLGFYDPAMGKIYYGGYDLETVDLRYLRKNISVVIQHGSLIVGTVYENITGNDESITEQEVNDIIKMTDLEETVANMPEGIHTRLEECRLSNAEMQKLLIAQAIIKRNRFIFLDEATSSMDNESQSRILEIIKQIKATKIIIAQRLETVKFCDKIVVMDDGRIIKSGAYYEIIEK